MSSSKDISDTSSSNFYNNIKQILQTARNNAYKQVNFIMVESYWHVGQKIVEEEQNGEDRAKYGSFLIKELSIQLTSEFGKGFTLTNLKMMRQFYNSFSNSHTLCDQLSWSHYRLLIRVKSDKARTYYMEESAKSNWSVRALERQINTHYYERLLSSKVKQPVIDEAIQNTKDDNPTIGIVLCSHKDETVVKYSHINDKDNLFVSKYQMYLPSEEELVREVQRDVFEIEMMREKK